ncbi:hypothetical protein ACTFR8_23410 [Bacillus cereus group sp. MYBK15-3]|uniref:hypothetical protein n=1 Tax=Bacillus cereus group TaxID=86661 RepID=UPI001C8CD4F2|nr:hypothetical protein [Bacillus cereus]MBX9158547.1 hypothetical protein [Bacillus cereus]
MRDKTSMVIGSLLGMKRHGWCNISKSYSEEIKIIKNVLEECGEAYTTCESDKQVKFFVKYK